MYDTMRHRAGFLLIQSRIFFDGKVGRCTQTSFLTLPNVEDALDGARQVLFSQ
jgi:hypothetical protein